MPLFGGGRHHEQPHGGRVSQRARPNDPFAGAFGMDPGGDPFGGFGLGQGMMQHMMNPGAGGGAGSSCCFSCTSCTCSSGPNGAPVTYSSTTTGARHGDNPMVSETQASYRDGRGNERLGISRQIGERGRAVVAERNARGEETKVDTLMHVSDGSAFDREWHQTAQRSHLQSASALAGPVHGALLGGPTAHASRPALTTADRQVMSAGRDAHRRQTERMIREARDTRREQLYPGLRPA